MLTDLDRYGRTRVGVVGAGTRKLLPEDYHRPLPQFTVCKPVADIRSYSERRGARELAIGKLEPLEEFQNCGPCHFPPLNSTWPVPTPVHWVGVGATDWVSIRPAKCLE